MESIDAGLACDDCVIAIANDDYSGMDDKQEKATKDGIDRLGKWLIVGEEYGFSWRRCDVCDGLAGNRHEISYLE